MKKELFDLTNPQKSIWLTEQYFPGTNLNVISGNLMIEESVNFHLLEKALNYFVKKNEGIRSRIVAESGEIKQYFKDYTPFSIPVFSVTSDKETENITEKIVHTPFDLFDSDLFRFTLFQYPDGTGGFNSCFHHLVADAWTLSLFIKEVMSLYTSLLQTGECDLSSNSSYSTFIQTETNYLNSDKYTKDTTFWEESFSFEPKLSSISTSLPNSSDIHAVRKIYTLDSSLYEKIAAFCKELNCSIYTFFMAVYGVYLSRINRTNTPIVGTPILNRCNYTEKHTAGMFISTVPFTVSIPSEKTVRTAIREIATRQMSIFRHQRYPYQELLSQISKKYEIANNIYDVAISYQNARDDSASSSIPYHTKWYFNGCISDTLDIHFYDMDDTGMIQIYYDYQTAKLTEEQVNEIHERILYIAQQMLENPDVLLKDLSIICPKEKKKIIEDFNSSFVKHPYNIGIHELIHKVSQKSSNLPAVVHGNKTMNYDELDSMSTLVAKNLIKQGIQKGDCVAVLYGQKDIPLIYTLLGILKAGACFLAIYPDYPNDRIQYMLENSDSKLLITEKAFSSYEFTIPTLVCENLEEIEETYSFPNTSGDDNAYFIYTSGSTGNPKGTMQTHNNVINFVYSFQKFLDDTISEEDHFLSVTNICFDVSMAEIFTPLLFGASLYLYKDLNYSNPYELVKYIINKNITFAYFPPSMLQSIQEELHKFKKIPLTKLLVGVEPIKVSVLQGYLSLNPDMKIINGYGPSETTICCTMYPFSRDLPSDTITPIGSPIGNSKILICDNEKHLVPIGEIGEVYVEGECVGNGYRNNPEKTKERFNLEKRIYRTGDLAKWLPDGNILFIGREDNQIKYRGYRIDLGEIEHTIKNIVGVENCVVILHKDSSDTTNLVAFICLKDPSISEEDFRNTLTKTLPHYMIPNQFLFLDQFPLTPNGKIDRKTLLKSASYKTETAYIAPKSKAEKDLVSIWQNVLGKDKIGINDNFFDLGGDSLDAIKIVTLAAQSGIELIAQNFYNYPTISLLLKHMKKEESEADNTYLPKVIIDKTEKTGIQGDILLIGATGFLGAHLLYSILKRTSFSVYCLIRGDSEEKSWERLKERLHFYFGEELDSYWNTRLFILKGDFTKKQLGLSNSNYESLSSHIKTVINSAAIVKHVGNYDYFYKINIASVENLIAFCKTSGNAHLVHISTLSVSGNRSSIEGLHSYTEEDLYIHQNIEENVYIQTKFEAEQLLAQAIEEGFPATIFRLGNITWRTGDGKFQINSSENLFFNVLKFMIKTQKLPVSIQNFTINMSPVDDCAKLILNILQKENHYNIYHIFNKNVISLKTLVTILNAIEGIHIEFIEDTLYQKTFEKTIADYPSISEFFETLSQKSNIIVNSPYTSQVLEDLQFHWTTINRSYLQKNLGGVTDEKNF